MKLPQRVVVTGIGVVAANGIGKEEFWKSLLAGTSGIGLVTLYDASETLCQIAGEVKDFIPTRFIDAHMKPRRMSRCTQMAVSAAKMALDDSGLDAGELAAQFPLPLIMGVSTSAPDMWEQHRLQIEKRGPANGPPYIIGAFMPHAAVNAISACLHLETHPMTMASACAAGMDAIGAAADLIRSGQAEIAIAGGADAPISYTSVTSFLASGLISPQKENPEKACRPFDRDRDCGVLAEGAGVVVLENMNHALARGSQPYLEIKGHAMNTDHDHSKPGSGLVESMRMAMANAGRGPEHLEYINAHGPGDPVLDRLETEAIKVVMGKRAYEIPVSSIKGATGNPLAAAGPLQLAACALMFRHDQIPPTANLEHPGQGCDLDYVAHAPRAIHLRYAMINNHGLGGRNCSVLVGRLNGQ